MRRRYLVTYDISDDKRRDLVFKTLRDRGDHVQFSVFLCEL
ncbi:MAG TPA: CRISPR-associated endonuclease Cas2, partial [Phycisphaerae bacterium]|nr:CRISPR-associated endonuclease Cas2 [Phycisphaerae bacterium]